MKRLLATEEGCGIVGGGIGGILMLILIVYLILWLSGNVGL